MLDFETLPVPAQPGTFTDHKLFASKAPYRGPKTTSGARKVVRKNGGVNREEERGEGEDNSDDEDGGNVGYVSGMPPPLLEDAALVTAVSENRMAVVIQEWKMEESSGSFRCSWNPPRTSTLVRLKACPDISRYCVNG
jgi:hypothetical protein